MASFYKPVRYGTGGRPAGAPKAKTPRPVRLPGRCKSGDDKELRATLKAVFRLLYPVR